MFSIPKLFYTIAASMPLVMAGAIAVLLNNVLFVPWGLLADWIGPESSFIVWSNENIAPFFNLINDGSYAILALTLVIALGYNLAKSYDVDPLSSSIVAVGSFFVLTPLARVSSSAGWVTNYLGAQGIFVALFTGLVATTIFVKVIKAGIVIKMPEMVPPAVGRAFAAIIPGIVTLTVFAVIAYIFKLLPTIDLGELGQAPATIFSWVESNISDTLYSILGTGGGSSLIGALFASLLSVIIAIFWSVGLHGANLLTPVLDGIYLPWQVENIEAFSKGQEVAHIWVRGSWDAYVFLGGSGATLALIAAIFFASKRKDEREIAKLSAAPGAFMINEPIIFGLPIVLNPLYIIPFVLNQPILTFIAYMATSIGLVGPIVNTLPWTTPPFLGAFLATNGDFMAVLLAIVNFIIAFLIYLPFVKASNKNQVNLNN